MYSWLKILLVPLFLILTLVLFWPGLQGGFYFDDKQNLLENPNIQLDFDDPDFLDKALNSGVAGISGRPLSMLSFSVQHAFDGGLNPLRLKLVNLSIHLTNALLVFLLFSKILAANKKDSFYGLKNRQLAAFLAILWLLAPINVGSVIYIVQRMNLLASLFVLAAMLAYVHGRWFSPNRLKGIAYIALCAVLILLGFFSKENAVLCIPFLLLLEFAVALQREHDFQNISMNKRLGRLQMGLAALAVITIVFLSWVLIVDPLGFQQGYKIRGYSMSDRMLTQPFILLSYLVDILVPLPGSIRFNLDFFENTSGYPSDLAIYLTLFFFLLLITLAIYLFCYTKHVLLVCLTIGWFLVFHAMESTFIPLEFAFNHRNYLPSAGILLLLVLMIGNLVRQIPATKLLVILYFLLCGITAYAESRAWGNSYLLYSREAGQEPVSVRANIGVAGLLLNLQQEDESLQVCPEVNAAYARIRTTTVEQDSLNHTLLKNRGICGNTDYQVYLNQLSQSYASEPFNRRRADIFQQMNRACIDSVENYCDYLKVLVNALKENFEFQNSKDHPLYDEVVLIEAFIKRRDRDFSAAYELVQSVLARHPEHYLAHYTMFMIVYETSGCEALKQSMQSLYIEDQGFQLQLYRELNERFGHCI